VPLVSRLVCSLDIIESHMARITSGVEVDSELNEPLPAQSEVQS